MYSNIYIIRELYTCWGSVYKSHNNKRLALVMLCRKMADESMADEFKAEESMDHYEFKPKESKGDE